MALPVKLLAGLATTLIALVGTASVASAHSASVIATARCTDGVGVVSYTALDWTPQPPNDIARTNPQIEIAYSTTGTGGSFTVVKVGAFNSADNFTFSGTFVPAPDTS
ncbi:MAG TPA: hypothetical protein VKQ71_11325, partial [Acidimicrobiales bacterium]|nr:hypothetical protein [Acidimicrobiales bacterium]